MTEFSDKAIADTIESVRMEVISVLEDLGILVKDKDGKWEDLTLKVVNDKDNCDNCDDDADDDDGDDDDGGGGSGGGSIRIIRVILLIRKKVEMNKLWSSSIRKSYNRMFQTYKRQDWLRASCLKSCKARE